MLVSAIHTVARQIFELLARAVVLGGIRSLCGGLRAPERVRESKLDPTSFRIRRLHGGSFLIQVMRLGVRGFGVKLFGFRFESLIIGLLLCLDRDDGGDK